MQQRALHVYSRLFLCTACCKVEEYYHCSHEPYPSDYLLFVAPLLFSKCVWQRCILAAWILGDATRLRSLLIITSMFGFS